MKSLFILLSVLLLTGCNKEIDKQNIVSNTVSAKVGDIVMDNHGHKYRKLTEEKITNGIGAIDIWEKIDPFVSNKWYTPTLSSRIFTNVVEFNSLYRGEEKP